MTTLSPSTIPIPEVSVIMPTYNRISMLEEALASIFSQEFHGTIEIIVVDDNSQDGTSEIVSQKYPSVHLISLEQNAGAYVARNRALLEAKGKYIAFLDSDDLWETNYLKTQIAALSGKERCFSVSDLVIWYTETDHKLIRVQKPDLTKYTSPIHHLLVGTFIYSPSSVIIPRQAFDEVGLFDETFRVGGDSDLYARFVMSDYTPIFTELPVAVVRKHNKGHLTDPKNLEIRKKGRLSRINRLYPLVERRFNIVPIRRIYAEIHANFASQYFKKNYFFHWLTSSIASARNASPRYALFNMLHDVKARLYGSFTARSRYFLASRR